MEVKTDKTAWILRDPKIRKGKGGWKQIFARTKHERTGLMTEKANINVCS